MVLLSDWWLVKVGVEGSGKKLAIGGIEEGPGGPRIFTSAPIMKRFRADSVETADGITVLMCGLVNKWRCRDNGFPLEVGERFLFGFPNNWEACADRFFAEESPRQHYMKSASEVATAYMKGTDRVDDSCEYQSSSVSSFPCGDSKEAVHGTDWCSAATGAQNNFLAQLVQPIIKDETEPTSPIYIQQEHLKPLDSEVKKEECDSNTSGDAVMQGSYSCGNTRKTFASLEKLNLRRSRSGRVIIPCLNAGSQSIVYDAAKYLHRCIGRIEHQLLQLQLSGTQNTCTVVLGELNISFCSYNYQDGAISGILTDVDDYKSLLAGEKTISSKKKKKKRQQSS